MRESDGRVPVPDEDPSDELGYLTVAESYTGEMQDGGISTPERKSCPRQTLQPGISGDEKERNVTRIFCVRVCTWLSLRCGRGAGHSFGRLKDPEGKRGKENG